MTEREIAYAAAMHRGDDAFQSAVERLGKPRLAEVPQIYALVRGGPGDGDALSLRFMRLAAFLEWAYSDVKLKEATLQ